MGIMKERRLHLTIRNESGIKLKIDGLKAYNGYLVDEKNTPRTIDNKSSVLIKAKRSVTYGPIVKVEISGDPKNTDTYDFKMLVFAELSINPNNPRCCYAIPDGLYTFDGMNRRYKYTHKNGTTIKASENDSVTDFYATVTIGQPKPATTFFHISDTHIGYEYDKMTHNNKDQDFEVTDAVVDEEYKWHREVVRQINLLASMGSNHPNMLGVIHTGDIFGSFDEPSGIGNDKAIEAAFNKYFTKVYKRIYSRPNHFLKDTSLDNDTILYSHLFEGVGNHDDCCAGIAGSKHEVWDDVVNRSDRGWTDEDGSIDSRYPSAVHNSGVDVDRKRAHYYWDWWGVRFIQINLSVVNGMYSKTDNYTTYGYNSYDYLKDVLKESTDKPVIICTHIGPKEDAFIAEEDREKFIELLKLNKNIIAILHGHTHQAKRYLFEVEPGDEIPCIDAGRCLGEKNGNVRKGTVLKFNFAGSKLNCQRYSIVVEKNGDHYISNISCEEIYSPIALNTLRNNQ